MISRLSSIIALLISFFILILGHGLLNTLLGIRANIENYPAWLVGIMGSGYYIGFVAGTVICGRLIPTLGHIRTFAVFASLASALSLVFILLLNPSVWVLSRTLYGLCIACLYMVIESWLNSFSTNEIRGRVLSVYMIISYLSISLGQFFMLYADPVKFDLFALCSILLSLSLIPLSASRSKQPEVIYQKNFSIKKLYSISPLATVGCFSSGILLGSFWTLASLWLLKTGFVYQEVAMFVSVSYLGGLIFQWPLGVLSDKADRRFAIAITSFICVMTYVALFLMTLTGHTSLDLTMIIVALFFGGTNYALYSLQISLVNDFVDAKEAVNAAGGTLALHAFGAIIGPLLTSGAMSLVGSNGYLIFTTLMSAVVFGVACIQIIRGREIPKRTSEDFVAIPRTGVGFLALDPRGEERTNLVRSFFRNTARRSQKMPDIPSSES